jgi:glutathione S-transferase
MLHRVIQSEPGRVGPAATEPLSDAAVALGPQPGTLMITLHHLRFSRSTRILWLLEEIGIDYELVVYDRDAAFRAPDTLKAVHPLGKAPVIVDGELVLAESSAILRYLDQRYNGGRLAPPAGTADHALHDEWLDLVEGSAAMPAMLILLGRMTGGLNEALGGFATAEFGKILGHIAARVADRAFLMGDRLTLADIQMSYILAAAQGTGALGQYPAITAYLERLYAQPGLQRAIERGGPMTPPRTRS